MATGFSKTILTENEANNLDTNGQNNKSQPRIKMKRETSSGTLEIFGHGNYSRENSSSSFDNSLNRTKKEKPAPRPNSKSGFDRTTPTSSKQISLQTVRRKPESDDMELQDLEVHNEEKEKSLNERLEKLNLSGRGSRTFFQRNSAQDEDIKNNRNKSASDDDDDDDDNDDDDSSEDEDDEKPKAPNELFMEFLTCIMNKDYTTAKKLCRMILIFEPDHEEALSFQKLIDEKILLDEEPDVSEDEERESGHEELDSDSGSDDGDDDTSSDDSSDSSDEDSRPSTVDTTDSGIVSTSSD